MGVALLGVQPTPSYEQQVIYCYLLRCARGQETGRRR